MICSYNEPLFRDNSVSMFVNFIVGKGLEDNFEVFYIRLSRRQGKYAIPGTSLLNPHPGKWKINRFLNQFKKIRLNNIQ